MFVRDEQHRSGRAYVYPRSSDCILGGTLEVGKLEHRARPAETTAILKRCTDIAPGLVEAHVIESLAGLRTGRSEVRMDLDEDLLPVPVVHKYGHGGAGITIDCGCAQDVAALAAKVARR